MTQAGPPAAQTTDGPLTEVKQTPRPMNPFGFSAANLSEERNIVAEAGAIAANTSRSQSVADAADATERAWMKALPPWVTAIVSIAVLIGGGALGTNMQSGVSEVSKLTAENAKQLAVISAQLASFGETMKELKTDVRDMEGRLRSVEKNGARP